MHFVVTISAQNPVVPLECIPLIHRLSALIASYLVRLLFSYRFCKMSPLEIELIPLSAVGQLRIPLNAIGNLQLINDVQQDNGNSIVRIKKWLFAFSE